MRLSPSSPLLPYTTLFRSQQGAEVIQTLLKNASQPATSGIAAAVGFVTLLFGASGVFGELRDSLNTVWGVKSTSSAGLLGLRSEEHTSELQSRRDLVCRLL